ncbi:hypothetical protein ACLK19_24750 [Escherichia coli]
MPKLFMSISIAQSWVKSSRRMLAIRADVDDVLAQINPQVEAQPREWHQLVADLQREFQCPIPKACNPLSHYSLNRRRCRL